MIHIPFNSSNIGTIIGIDPGTTFVGIGFININLTNNKIISSDALTINGSKLYYNDFDIIVHGERYNRISCIEKYLIDIFIYKNPFIICAESPFFGLRHPNAFQALTEVICSIRKAVSIYNQSQNLYLVPPSNVKQLISLKGNSDKIVMKEKILNMDFLNYNGIIQMKDLDEHSIDALSVAYYAYNQFINN